MKHKKKGGKKVVGKKKKRLKLLVALFVFILMAVGGVQLYNSSFFNIEKIRIKGNKKLSKSRIIKTAEISPGMSLVKISSEKIKNKLKSEPWVEDVSIMKHYPRMLEIKVIERKPLGILNFNNSQYLVDKSQFVWKPEEGVYDLPLIKDINIEIVADSGKIESPELKNALLCLDNLELNNRKLLLAVSAPTVEGLILYLKDEILILYGKATEMKKKNYLLGLILSQARVKGEKLRVIDLRVPSRPVVKKLTPANT